MYSNFRTSKTVYLASMAITFPAIAPEYINAVALLLSSGGNHFAINGFIAGKGGPWNVWSLWNEMIYLQTIYYLEKANHKSCEYEII